MSAFDILELVKTTNCYPNILIAYEILLTISMIVVFTKIIFFKVKIIEKLLEISSI
jgi:hypothetical protein